MMHSTAEKVIRYFLIVILGFEILLPFQHMFLSNSFGDFLLGFCLLLLIRMRITSTWLSIIYYVLVYLFMCYIRLFAHMTTFSQIPKKIYDQFKLEISILDINRFLVEDYPLLHTMSILLTLTLLVGILDKMTRQPARMWMVWISFMIYLVIQEMYVDYNVTAAGMRVIIYLCLYYAWSHHRQLRKSLPQLDELPSGGVRWATLVLIGAIVIAAILPKPEMTWRPDPIVYLEGAGKLIGVNSDHKQIGYSRDSDNLGGNLQLDDTILFEATVDELAYWRGESIVKYTGRGWETYDFDKIGGIYSIDDLIVDQPPPHNGVAKFEGGEETENRAVVKWMKPQYETLFIPGNYLKNVVEIDEDTPPKQQLYYSKVNSIYFTIGDKLKSYSMTTSNIKYDVDFLRDKKREQDFTVNGVLIDPTDLYLQIPKGFPTAEVRELASSVSADETNRYDRVKAIENFLEYNGAYQYALNAGETPQNEDFVAHFLLQSKRGYCDHFSSSMVMMLRTLDIPARWAIGFTSGESNYNEQTNRYEVTVRNKNAHSWVEVYFGDAGWIPFDPTPGFSVPSTLMVSNTPTTGQEEDTPATNLSPGTVDNSRNERPNRFLEEERTEASASQTGKSVEVGQWYHSIWLYLLVLISLLILVFFLWRSYQARLRWSGLRLSAYLPWSNRRFRWQFARLLALHHKPDRGDTIRDQLVKGQHDLTSEIQYCMKLYEQMNYSAEEIKVDAKEAKRMWEMVLKQLRP
ncbi:transglutaminase domain-containing protein [Hazenella sp. IB182357]|uniref:Transglutaminase domain-containing protein n=1 Tax=Polycladospora coralii TaxID=2771432 RepID=A0A926NF60_9BACL|nr:transglutaminase domain-containing protein [Polycladospora coralii]MBD1372273.1 transglutaminase domain-containing protein [Polycladospora coralii]